MIRRRLAGRDGMDNGDDRGPIFDGVKIGRPATGALVGAGFETLAGLPDDLDGLSTLHGVGPAAIERLKAARAERSGGAAG
jgi:hypothetical protein